MTDKMCRVVASKYDRYVATKNDTFVSITVIEVCVYMHYKIPNG